MHNAPLWVLGVSVVFWAFLLYCTAVGFFVVMNRVTAELQRRLSRRFPGIFIKLQEIKQRAHSRTRQAA